MLHITTIDTQKTIFIRILINKQNNDKLKFKKMFYFHFCRQADCFVRMLHTYTKNREIKTYYKK